MQKGKCLLSRFPAALTLPLILAACSHADRSPAASEVAPKGAGRDAFSPNIRDDPYVKAQWDTSVRALEQECARSGRYCAEASKAREAISR
jgi:hypothetical protein